MLRFAILYRKEEMFMLIRQQAFTGENKMLKGALHCHTTRYHLLV